MHQEANATRGLGRYVPLAYLALSMLLVLLLLPSALRPPPSQPPSAAAFDPDAPPDDQVLISELSQGRSATAGTGPAGLGVADGGSGLPVPRGGARSCPGGVGVPPRQVESLYSAPCVPAWQGDNGGATWKGVTPTEVRVAVTQDDGFMDPSHKGFVPEQHNGSQNEALRTYSVFQAYINANYQFYGRKFRIYLNQAANGSTAQKAAVAEADANNVFGIMANSTFALEDSARRKMVGVGGFQLPHAVYERNRPYLHSWWMDGTKLARFTAEYICKRLSGGVARNAGPADSNKTRKFGMIMGVSETGFGHNGFVDLPQMLREGCNEPIEVITYGNTNSSRDAESYGAGIAKMRAAGVTTIVAATDPIFISPFTHAADAQGYLPEWFSTGMWLLDHPFIPKLFGYNQNQWSRAFGLTPSKIYLPSTQMDWFRAYKTIDPDNQTGGEAEQMFPHVLTMANGIQMAGPKLTPETFHAGLVKMGYRDADPAHSLAGGYGPNDFSYSDVVSEQWWDPASSGYDGLTGTYIFPDCIKRFRLGEIPSGEPVRMFQRGTGCPYPRDVTLS